MTIRDNYQLIVEKVAKAAKSCGRSPEEIRLVVVTKTHPIEIIQEVIDAGAVDLGENYVEDAVPKIIHFRDKKNLNWHMVGHVQSRKSPMVCEYFDYLHSLDSLKLAKKLNNHLSETNKSLPVWLEFNVGGEDSKSGWDIWNEENWRIILPDFEQIITYPSLHILGLMTIPPYSSDPESSRPYYQKLKKFQEFLISHFKLSGLEELSIGMSGDFEVAIQEGSTCVRIGQAILGPRR